MSSQSTSSRMLRNGARIIATELLREPVKQAVREALREEIVSIKSTGEKVQMSTSSGQESSEDSRDGDADQTDDQSSGGGGRSKFATFGLVLALVGITYLARRRMSSTSGAAWSESSPGSIAEDDAEGGYVSEGEMQTAETADEDNPDAGASPSTAADR